MYAVAAVVILGLSASLYGRVTSLAVTRLNMASFVFYLMIGSSFIGATTVLYGLGDQSHLSRLSDDSIRLTVWYAVMWAMLTIPVGMRLANAVFLRRNGTRAVKEYLDRSMTTCFEWSDQSMKLALYGASVIAIASLIYNLRELEGVPLLSVLAGERDVTTLALQRASSRISVQHDSRWLLIIEMYSSLTQLLAYVAYSYWTLSRRRSDAFWCLIMFVAAVVSLTYNLSKASLMVFIAGLVIVMAQAMGRAAKLRLTAISISCCVVLFYMYSFYRDVRVDTFGEAFTYTWFNILGQRLAWGNLMPFYYSLDIFPKVIPHLGLSSTGRLIHEWLQLPYYADTGFQVMQYWDPVGVKEGGAGHASALFLSEAWANFGFWGIVIAPVFVGFMIQGIHVWFLRARKTPLHVGLYAYVTTLFPIINGFQGFYYPEGLLQLAFVVATWVVAGLILRSTAHRATRVPRPVEQRVPPRWRASVIQPKS